MHTNYVDYASNTMFSGGNLVTSVQGLYIALPDKSNFLMPTQHHFSLIRPEEQASQTHLQVSNGQGET